MIRISPRQRATFDAEARADFERHVAARLGREFPRHVAALGDARGYVREGIERAARHGIDTEGGVELWLNLMLLLGADFDTDPQLPWAAAILAAPGPFPAPRAEHLYARAWEHVERVAGPDSELLVAAIRRFVATRFDELPSQATEAVVAEHLRALYPEKHAELGEAGAQALAAQAARAAERHGHTDARAVLVCADMMLVLGSGFERDPVYAWAASASRRSQRKTRPRARAQPL